MTAELKVQGKKEERRFWEAIYWGGVLAWAGLIFLIDSSGNLPEVGEADAWTWIFLGVGLYGLLGSLYRQVSTKWSDPTTWDYVWSGFWLLVGIGGLITSDIFWPVVLVVAGVAIVANTLLRRG